MGFDVEAFRTADLKPRQARVAVPALAPFFADGAEPVWVVRGLTGVELHRALEAEERNRNIESFIKAIATKQDQIDAFRRLLGLGDQTPSELAKRIEMLALGSVSPAVDVQDAVRLAERFPMQFMELTREIWTLTCSGADMGKPVAASNAIPV